MFRMKITVVHNFVLLFLYWTCGMIKNDLITVCEKESVNITCEHGTKIQIQGVQYGPLSLDNTNHSADMTQRGPTSNSTILEILCNDRSYCCLNESGIFEFDKYPYISRLINIKYYCDFEYYGCYEDDKNRLFKSDSKGSSDVDTIMSALICRTFCSGKNSNWPYFGTEAGYACFCGTENEINKLNSTTDPNYKWHDDIECNSKCNGHEYETCGQDGLISIYTTETTQKNTKFNVEEVLGQKCGFNSSLKNVTMISYQRAKQCEREYLTKLDSYDCDDNSCWVKQVLPFVTGYLDHNLPKYMTINYRCIANNDNKSSTAGLVTEKPEYTGMIIGILSALTLLCGVIIGLCFLKRNRLKNSKEPDITTNSRPNQEIAEYENVQRVDEMPSSEIESEIGYSVVFKSKQKGPVEKLEQDNKTFSAPDDVYVDTGEGVYDISNKPRYKISNTDQAIYSHTSEGIYDTTNDHIPTDDENTYDQGFHQSEHNVYGISLQ